MKWHKMKKVTGLILSAALMIGLCQPMEKAKAEDNLLAGTELLAHYEFQDGGKDSSGKNNHATIGSGVTVKDGVASLPGGGKSGSAYITLPEGMFDRQDTLTISMWLTRGKIGWRRFSLAVRTAATALLPIITILFLVKKITIP